MDRHFTIEIRDYESGLDPDRLTTGRIERVLTKLLDRDGSDGVVIVEEKPAA
jgi:hypothetical protein